MNGSLTTDSVILDGITKRFDSVTAVHRMTLVIKRGDLFGLLGPNGAGKTTTLRMVMSVIAPDEGRVAVFGETDPGKAQNMIGYLPEERGLYPRMKVLDVLVFLGAMKGLSENEARRRGIRWLERMEIGEWAARKVIDLSKGMQQKVQFIAAVLHSPPLLILDEPFAGLDPVNAAVIKDIMLEMRAKGATIILSSHRMEQVEMMCESICLINAGEKVLDGELRAIKKQYGKNTLRVEYSGDGAFLDRQDLVASINRFGSVVEARLRPGADPQEILRLAIENGVRISRFELVEPPLNDIFIEKVSGSHAQNLAGN
ncbi:MAG: ATP-binding cassette domain-containing protein [Acidobacteriota bacterium]|nr:ATP-binding cassette domain-containing protein [Acidobacteriota bacterium]